MENNFDFNEFVEKYYKLNRAPVSDDISYFITKIKEHLPDGKILKSKSGQECLTWFTPKAWNVKHAILTDSKNKKILDFKDNPLYLMQYCSQFKGKIDFKELSKHITYSKEHPNEIPYNLRKQYQYKLEDTWGFSMPYNQYKQLDKNEKYTVDIDVEFSEKEMSVFDFFLPGKKNETIFFGAHSCHPAQVNDGIAGVALLIKLFIYLQSIKTRNYSYRLIIGPEYFAAAYILAHGDRIKDLKYGVYLDMMVHDGPIGFSTSFQRNTTIDFVTEKLQEKLKCHKKFGYRELWGNDEMFYDGPDFKIPTVGIGRSNFSNYHLSGDNPTIINKNSVDESYELLKKMIMTFENDHVIKKKFLGPLYLSRYDLYIDPKINPEGYKNLQQIQILIDGKKSTLSIAKQLDIDPDFVNTFANSLIKKNLATIV